ncbi:arsenate reductase (glutaredoxin) [Stenotrophomonas sp.]|uniref:arsenate reductase (glutaredoxin) n=1 Tax=Stenotrophomonas sp. TaxID=69392 RepID=UPI0028B1101D|nr:arsenate reductase (glutaredoxin) [Stenotrophomonas sp.]
MTVTIWHNPRCGNSRGALEHIRAAGIEPVIRDYLTDVPSEAELRKVLKDAGLQVIELVRSKEAVFDELGLEGADDATLLGAMQTHPILINRPVVITPKGTNLCRPPEKVLALL